MDTPTPARHKIPFITIALFILAFVSMFLGQSGSDGTVVLPAIFMIARSVQLIIQLVFLVAFLTFFVGLTRFFVNSDQVKKNSGVHMMLWSLLAVALVVCAWISLRMMQTTFSVSNSTIATQAIPTVAYDESTRSYSDIKASSILPPQPQYGYGEVPATDTREFLKTDYNATIQTRSVQPLTKSVETIVRGHDGRVDQTSSSEQSGYVRFVIPAPELDDFRSDIESLVDSRFISISIDSQNLLPQKQGIEATQSAVESDLASLTAERKSLVSKHSSTVATLQSQINANTAESNALRAEVTYDPARQSQIASRQNELSNALASLNAQLSNENSTYSYNLKSLDAQIAGVNANLSSVQKQDKNLLDTVATVRGTITLRWISYMAIARLYLPGFWIPGILAALACIAYWFERRRIV